MTTHPTCRSHKIRYSNKTLAKRTIRAIQGRKGRMHPYRCPEDPTHWHIGHPPPNLTRGLVTRDQLAHRPNPTDGA
ncbi:hypothetical protein [Microcystis phage MinS1]|nr:hypothetical protein [Microcystis phage MinS1]